MNLMVGNTVEVNGNEKIDIGIMDQWKIACLICAQDKIFRSVQAMNILCYV
ncbi:hypothetical protein RJ641_018766 [Dillenia turbinata]|uniref:Uncharacterized protein n=1 Tax=Dillenia turbinata TaxID=194707 RepID=A0AAN8UHY1_9MAGN